ncbi:MAG TPA: hypothetical protein VLZ89_03320 [Anaerolineales bacterium]|nr:hypothetical protein [Anaerolineales bacterium]
MRCTPTAPSQPDGAQSPANFLNNYRGKLLIDLTGTTGEECSSKIKQFRPMMPIRAIFGDDLDASILEIPESCDAHAVRYSKTEAGARNWLPDQQTPARPIPGRNTPGWTAGDNDP